MIKKGIRERWAEMWGVGKELVMNLPHITLAGNREAYIENHTGIALYTDTAVIVKTPSGNITINGEDMRIDTMNNSDMFVSGVFSCMSFDFAPGTSKKGAD